MERLGSPVLLLGGDAHDILDVVRSASLAGDVPVLPIEAPGADATADTGDATDTDATADSATAPSPPEPLATIVIVALRVKGQGSALARGSREVTRLAPRTAPDALRIVITERGAARVAPDRLVRVLGPELLHQIEYAVTDVHLGRPWRRFSRRVGLATLGSLGIRVFRVGAG